MDSDARLAEMHEQLMQIRAASESTEEKLRSEVRRSLPTKSANLIVCSDVHVQQLECLKARVATVKYIY